MSEICYCPRKVKCVIDLRWRREETGTPLFLFPLDGVHTSVLCVGGRYFLFIEILGEADFECSYYYSVIRRMDGVCGTVVTKILFGV